MAILKPQLCIAFPSEQAYRFLSLTGSANQHLYPVPVAQPNEVQAYNVYPVQFESHWRGLDRTPGRQVRRSIGESKVWRGALTSCGFYAHPFRIFAIAYSWALGEEKWPMKIMTD